MCSSCCCLYLRLLRCHRTCALFPYTTLFRSDRAYRLAARDIAQHPLSARLVTISSCDGAGTATYAGEGLVGLAWAFLHAGAQRSEEHTSELQSLAYLVCCLLLEKKNPLPSYP